VIIFMMIFVLLMSIIVEVFSHPLFVVLPPIPNNHIGVSFLLDLWIYNDFVVFFSVLVNVIFQFLTEEIILSEHTINHLLLYVFLSLVVGWIVVSFVFIVMIILLNLWGKWLLVSDVDILINCCLIWLIIIRIKILFIWLTYWIDR
jgi:hypothetical protein